MVDRVEKKSYSGCDSFSMLNDSVVTTRAQQLLSKMKYNSFTFSYQLCPGVKHKS